MAITILKDPLTVWFLSSQAQALWRGKPRRRATTRTRWVHILRRTIAPWNGWQITRYTTLSSIPRHKAPTRAHHTLVHMQLRPTPSCIAGIKYDRYLKHRAELKCTSRSRIFVQCRIIVPFRDFGSKYKSYLSLVRFPLFRLRKINGTLFVNAPKYKTFTDQHIGCTCFFRAHS